MMLTSFSFPQCLALCLVFVTQIVSGWDINNPHDRQACQLLTSNPLSGCDLKRTLLVDGNGGDSIFKTVQSAVASLPNNTETYIILITSGNYTEQVNVTRAGPTYLLGQTMFPTMQEQNTVAVIWRAIAVTGLDNAFTSTLFTEADLNDTNSLTIAPNLNASLTGSGTTGFAVPANTPFGCVDFRTYNIDFINDFAPYSDDPSLALSISYANCGFYYTGFYSYQDTVYVGKLGNAYFHSGTVAGQTDFFYGFGTAWVANTSIELRNCGGGITAWKGTNTTFPNKYGIYIVHSSIHASNTSIAPIIKNKCALGRPWNANMRAIVAKTYLDASILSTGYIDWNPSRYDNYTLQAEFENFGPGYNVTGRAVSRFDVQLNRSQWEEYHSPGKVFQFQVGGRMGEFGNMRWIDFGV